MELSLASAAKPSPLAAAAAFAAASASSSLVSAAWIGRRSGRRRAGVVCAAVSGEEVFGGKRELTGVQPLVEALPPIAKSIDCNAGIGQQQAFEKLIFVTNLVFRDASEYLLPWKRLFGVHESQIDNVMRESAKSLYASQLKSIGRGLDIGKLIEVRREQLAYKLSDEIAAEMFREHAKNLIEENISSALDNLNNRTKVVEEVKSILAFNGSLTILSKFPGEDRFVRGLGPISLGGDSDHDKRVEDLKMLYNAYTMELLSDGHLDDDKLAALNQLRTIFGLGKYEAEAIISDVKAREWTLWPLPSGEPPRCTLNSTATAFVLSTGGFTGNPFHDYTDVLIPAFITAHRYAGEVQFLVSSYKPWWMNKYVQIFQQMSRYDVVDIDGDADGEVRCYRNVVVGATFHKELGVDPSKTASGVSVLDFRTMLRGAFGLDRATATPSGDRWDIRRRPRLLIISRRASRGRAFMNERAMADMAASLGFDVRVGEPDASTDTSKFARLVNSCDVMVGVHGAGLTNMVFLPAGAVLVQVVPYGKLEWLARNTFAEPSSAMEIHYLEYVVQLDETTLSEQYPADHPVLRDPMSIHKQGWEALKTTYLDKQNVRPHLGRLKNTFLQALKLLPHDKETMN
uniref:Glycosyltransferase 61 catalytic domain-containing protein n=1 Tax=Leersia perrieri TaxID=77586 RepID=A0A0D9XKZ4_9ORYZ